MAEVEQKFKVGDIVTLKSGSPKMTISNLDMKMRVTGATVGKYDIFTGIVECQWFVDTDIKTASFHQDAIETVTV